MINVIVNNYYDQHDGDDLTFDEKKVRFSAS